MGTQNLMSKKKMATPTSCGSENVGNSFDAQAQSASVDEQPVYTVDIYQFTILDNLDSKARAILVQKWPMREDKKKYEIPST